MRPRELTYPEEPRPITVDGEIELRNPAAPRPAILDCTLLVYI
jgi:hypothetical protein